MIPQYFLNHSTLHNIQKWFLQCIQRPWQLDLQRGFSVHQFHTAVQKLTDIVNASPYFRNSTVYTEKSVYSLHCSTYGIFCCEYGITRSFRELAQECKVYTAIRDNIRAVTFGTRHEEGGDVRHHGRNADSAVFCHIVDLIYRNTQVVQPLGGNFLTGTILHRLLDIITGNICEQSVNPYTDLLRILLFELSLTVDGPA